jgi:hypothetical protein
MSTNEHPASKEQVTIWYEEYRNCSCSFMARDKNDLPGYCPKHGNDKRIRKQVADVGYMDKELGYAG